MPVALLAASASEVLENAGRADRFVNYRGIKEATVRYSRGTAKAVFKVVHLRPDKTRTEYFKPSAIAGVILIENGPDAWRYDPKGKYWEEMGPCDANAEHDISADAFANYSIRLIGSEVVAGRNSYVLHAIPKTPGDWARRIWIDKETYLVVKSQVESTGGAVVSSACFRSLQVNPGDISPSIFKVNGDIKKRSKPSSTAFTLVKPSYLPKGYKLVSSSSLNVNGCASVHMLFSNGVNSISLFERKTNAKDSAPKQVGTKTPAVFTWVNDGVHFTLVSDIAREELKRIAESVK